MDCCAGNQFRFPIRVCPRPAVRQLHIFDLFTVIWYVYPVGRKIRRIAHPFHMQCDSGFCCFIILCIIRCKYDSITRLIAVCNVRPDGGILPRKASAHRRAGNAVPHRSSAQYSICQAFAPGDLCRRRILVNLRLCFFHLHFHRRADSRIIFRSGLRKDCFVSTVVHSGNDPCLLPAPRSFQSRPVYTCYNAAGQITVFQRFGRIIGSLCHGSRRFDGGCCLIDYNGNRSIDRLIRRIRRFELPCANRNAGIRHPAAIRPAKRAFNDISIFIRKYRIFKEQLGQRFPISQHIIFQPHFHAGF